MHNMMMILTRSGGAAVLLSAAASSSLAQLPIPDPQGLGRAVELAVAQRDGQPIRLLANGGLRAQAIEAAAPTSCQPIKGDRVTMLEQGHNGKGIVTVRVEVTDGQCAHATGWVDVLSVGAANGSTYRFAN